MLAHFKIVVPWKEHDVAFLVKKAFIQRGIKSHVNLVVCWLVVELTL